MCGRFTLIIPGEELAHAFNLPQAPTLTPRYNIAPTQPVAAVRQHPESGQRELTYLHWGLIPFWAKDTSMASRMINARSETVAEKPAYRAAFKYRRCIIPASGFYEWQKQNGQKQPHYIHHAEGAPLGLAGLWEHWQGADGSEIESCTILTTRPNDLIKPLHNRMPVILEPEDYDAWLQSDGRKQEELQHLLRPAADDMLEAYPISTFVNRPQNEGPECIAPLAES
ncbi:MAG TPA: SOS response-associated peptidase [Candidatus Sulfomarinibacteraceae bacterium]|nr:SOS response-associated peptidase [Candidatus Sulfomarinibacteraceae bacterium]